MKKLSVIQADNITIGLTLIYLYMAKNMCETFGIEGESAVRKGLAEYATVRGSDLRKKHMALGMKTNLKNFFYYGSNPYSEASFVNHMGHVTEQEDVRQTSYCPFVDEMIKRGYRKLAITYCEEVHPPLWQSYAPTAIVNLGKHLAQEGTDRCLFDVFLRPGRMTPEQRKECFEEYDPDFKGDRREEYTVPDSKTGNCNMTIIMVASMYRKCTEIFGEAAVAPLAKGLEEALADYVQVLKASAKELQLPFDDAFIDKNYVFNRTLEEDPGWEDFADQEIREFARVNLYDRFAALVAAG